MLELAKQNQIFLNHLLDRNPALSALKFEGSDDLCGENASNRYVFGEKTVDDWLKSKNRIFLHPQLFPSDIGVKWYNDLIKDIDPKGSVMQYVGMVENDPHLLSYILKLRDIEQELGANPNNQNTALNYIPSLLISFGTGDGKLLKQLVEHFNPFHLCIVIRSLDDLVSSFDVINWSDWWNTRFENTRQKISILPYETTEELRHGIVSHAFLTGEHAVMTCPASSNPNYIDDRDNLCSREMAVQVNYLGFTIDEYNMIWNSVQSLCKTPKIFKGPSSKTGGNFVVCGSGPSLDSNLDYLKSIAANCTIVACASNYRSLRAAGIEVDILCLLERGNYEYDNYLSVKEEYGIGNTRLFASVTCDARLHDLFDDSMIFFRPQLTPLSIFSTEPSQILNHEGPQTVNTGIALCAALGADNVILVGVDLGAIDKNNVRSKKAVGVSERTFDIKVKGNFEEFAYSTDLLLDGALAMEGCIKANPQINVFNASNGIFIKGTEPMPLNQLQFLNQIENVADKKWRLWWDRSSVFNSNDLLNQWKSSRIRPQISELLQSVRRILNSETPWFIGVQEELNELLRLNVPISKQAARRMHRSILLKMALVITRQSYVLLYQQPDDSSMQEEFVKKARLLMVELCDQLEEESYELFDVLENQLAQVAHHSKSYS